MGRFQAQAFKTNLDPVLYLIEKSKFTDEECAFGTHGLCAIFALALYRCIQNFDPILVFVCSEINSSPRDKLDNGLYWHHAAVRVKDSYYDIEGLQKSDWLINNYISPAINSKGIIVEVTLEEFLEEIRKNPFISLKTKNWQFLVKCKKKLGFYQTKMSVKA